MTIIGNTRDCVVATNFLAVGRLNCSCSRIRI